MEDDNDIPIKGWRVRKTVTFSAEKTIKIIKYTFSIIGLVLIAVSIFLFISTNQFAERSATALGTVIALEESSSSYGIAYHPVVEFKVSGDRTYQFRSSAGSNPPSYHIGEHVEVFYDPTSPSDARIKSFMSLWFPVVITGTLGIIFLSVGIGMILYFRPSKNVANKPS